MTLRLYNTLTRTKEDFVPLDPTNVRMYVCGPTVYDYAHIGNARPAIVFDVLFRLLRYLAAKGEWDGGKGETRVTYVRNITDVDDKINARALELQAGRNVPLLDIVRELTAETAKIYDEDMAALGNLAPTHAPRATQHIPQMIRMIEALIASGHAYVAQGHVLFDVSSKADYGKLARRSVDDMIAGARVDPAPYKRNPMDFVLWKPSDEKTPGWQSPWGFGRPGWHLECSAMSAEYLGETFDIHGGGIDLVFPHHENEIAQSECAHHGHPIARYWLHNGHLNVEGAKMSKSLGNFVTIRDLLSLWPGDALRLNMLRTNYDQPIDWTEDGLRRAMNDLRGWTELVALKFGENVDLTNLGGDVDREVIDALSQNLNTHLALSILGKLAQEGRTNPSCLRNFVHTALFLGFRHLNKPGFFDLSFSAPVNVKHEELLHQLQYDVLRFRAAIANDMKELAARSKNVITAAGFRVGINDAGTVIVDDFPDDQTRDNWIESKIVLRNAARARKEFKKADRIRDELDAKGIALKDNPDGTTTWEVKR